MVKPVDQLTEAESFAICIAAGVPVKSTTITRDGMFKTLLHPASIRIENGRYVVAVKKDRHEETKAT